MPIKFKSSGRVTSENHIYTQKVDLPPVGIRTPLRRSVTRIGPLEMHYSPADQIHDNLRNLILTNSGERLGRYTLGTNIRTLLFDLASADDFEAKIMGLIRSSVSRYLPIVELDTFEIDSSPIENDNVAEGMSLVVIKVKYNIPRLNIIGRILDVTVYSGG